MVIFLFLSMHNIPNRVYRLVVHCGFKAVTVSPRTLNLKSEESFDIVRGESGAVKMPHKPCTCHRTDDS